MKKIDFNKNDINIFIQDTWQKYLGDSLKIQSNFVLYQHFWRKLSQHSPGDFFARITQELVRDSSAVRRLFVRLAGAVGRQSALRKENSRFAAPTLGRHISTFCHLTFIFRTYKRDLAILTEWWQQRIAWWKLLNAACQIICIRKQQHTNHMGDDIKRILQDKQFYLQLKSE